MTGTPRFIESRDNALLKELRKLAQDNAGYRKQQRVWLEGDHLCRAARQRGVRPAIGVYSDRFWTREGGEWLDAAESTVVVPDPLFDGLSGLESAGAVAFVVDLPAHGAIAPDAPTVILDRLQDAGNVGSILRSAAAFGFTQVLAIKGTAALWSPKVLRAGMGAHFGLALHEQLSVDDLDALHVPLVATSSHGGSWLHQAQLPWPCAWILGHEGQGVSNELADRASLAVRIVQPGGEESLNVAVAAAICMHASAAAQAPTA